MLDVAKERLQDAIQQHRIDAVVEARLPDLPFEKEIFGAVLFSQVSLIYSNALLIHYYKGLAKFQKNFFQTSID